MGSSREKGIILGNGKLEEITGDSLENGDLQGTTGDSLENGVHQETKDSFGKWGATGYFLGK